MQPLKVLWILGQIKSFVWYDRKFSHLKLHLKNLLPVKSTEPTVVNLDA